MTSIKELYKMNNKQVEPTILTIKYTLEILREMRKQMTYSIDIEPIDNKIAELEKNIFGMTFMDEINEKKSPIIDEATNYG